MTDVSVALVGAWSGTIPGLRIPIWFAVYLFAVLLLASVLWDVTEIGYTARLWAFGLMVGVIFRRVLVR